MPEKICRLEIRVDIQTTTASYSDEFTDIREAQEFIDEIMENLEE